MEPTILFPTRLPSWAWVRFEHSSAPQEIAGVFLDLHVERECTESAAVHPSVALSSRTRQVGKAKAFSYLPPWLRPELVGAAIPIFSMLAHFFDCSGL